MSMCMYMYIYTHRHITMYIHLCIHTYILLYCAMSYYIILWCVRHPAQLGQRDPHRGDHGAAEASIFRLCFIRLYAIS